MICPQCRSQRLYSSGFRYPLNKDPVQRWICRECSYRFSVGKIQNNPNKNVKQNNYRQFCVLKEAKKLDSATETKTVAGDITTLQKSKGRFVKFLSALENDGINENSAKLYVAYLKRIESSGSNLLDPESIKASIAKKEWSLASKALSVAAYSKYLSVVGGTWKPPKYQTERKLPYVPTEKELDCLINAAYNKHSAYLQLLKETGMRSSEAWNLKWKDVDFERNGITLNETLKHGTPRMFKVSSKLTAMLNALPKTSEAYIFQKDPPTPFGLLHFSRTFRNLRKRLAQKMQKPNINRITFHTFRHWYATMLYHKNGGKLLQVQEKLGHKSILTTMIYTHLINFEADAYDSAIAETVEEARKLIEAGFEFVCDMDGYKLFRKPK
jgi:integrase